MYHTTFYWLGWTPLKHDVFVNTILKKDISDVEKFGSVLVNDWVCPSIRFLDPPPPLLSILYMTIYFSKNRILGIYPAAAMGQVKLRNFL